MTLRDFVSLSKPGIVLGNVMITFGTYLLVARGLADFSVLVSACVGTAAVIAASCVINNYLDRKIDAYMPRTRRRASVSGAVPVRVGIAYAGVLYILGFWLLGRYVNLATMVVGAVGAVTYSWVYTLSKRHTPYATYIGTIPGAIPALAGYTAYTGHFGGTGWLVFVVLVCWQIPHFYAIALFRRKEYAAAKIPTWPAVYGVTSTIWSMRFFGVLYVVSLVTLWAWLGLSGIGLAVVLSVAVWWLRAMWRSSAAYGIDAWARHVFYQSLWHLPLLAAVFALNQWL